MALGAIVKASKFFGKKDNNQGKYTVEQKSLPSKNISKPKNSLVKILNRPPSGNSFGGGNSEATTGTRRKGGNQTDLVGVAKSIEEKVIKIDSILKDSYAFKQKQTSEEVRRKRSSKLEKVEKDLEKKAPSNFKSKIKLPTGGGKGLGILGFIKNFIFWTFIGWMYKKIIPFIPTILKVLSKITQVALSALEIFGGIADVLTKFVAGGIRLVNGLTKTLAVITGARTEQEIEKFTEKFNMVMDLALLAAMLAGDAGFSVLDLFKKKKGRDAAGKAVQRVGGVFRRGLGRAPQRIAAKVAGKKGATFVKGLTTGAKALGNKATGNIFRRGAGKATQRLAIKLGGKAGGQALAGTSKFLGKAAGPIGTVIGAGFEFAGRKSQGQSNLQAGVGTGASVAGALGGAAAGAKGGAAIGALIGSVIPGAGTLVGGAVGGFIGGIAGAIGGGWLAGKAADKVTGADKVGQYEKGGVVDSEKPRRKRIQDTVIGKDVGGLSGMSLLFSGGKTSKPPSNEDFKESESESQSNWWNPFSWGKSEQEDVARGQSTKNAKKPPGLESLEETSKFLKKIPFVGELMGVSVDIAMGQKPDKPVYKNIAEKIIYIGKSMTNVDKVSEISDRSNDIQQFKKGGLSSIQSPFVSPVEKANEELESTLTLMIEKGANDALMDIRERILQEQIKARRQSNQQSNQEPGSTSGPGSRAGERDSATGEYVPGTQTGTAPMPTTPLVPSRPSPTTSAPVTGAGADSFAIEMVKEHEGRRLDVYIDSEGYKTVGYGHLIDGGSPEDIRNLKVGDTISEERAHQLFLEDYNHHKQAAMKIPGFSQASPQQQAALIDLTFNMGPAWYQGFPKFTEAFSKGDYEEAANQLKSSTWYGQVGRRSPTIVNLIQNKGIPSSSGYLAHLSPPAANVAPQTQPSGSQTDEKYSGKPPRESTETDAEPQTAVGGGSIVEIGKNLISQQFTVAEHPDFTKNASPSGGSYTPGEGHVSNVHSGRGHYEGRAIDVTDWTSGYPGRYNNIASSLQKNPAVKMLIHDNWGFYKDGQKSGPGSHGHPTHLHVETKFHGGRITEDTQVKLHEGEFVMDKDSVNLLGTDFYKALNSAENKVSLMKISPDLIKRINEATKGKAYTPSETDSHPKGEGPRDKKEEDGDEKETAKNLQKAASGGRSGRGGGDIRDRDINARGGFDPRYDDKPAKSDGGSSSSSSSVQAKASTPMVEMPGVKPTTGGSTVNIKLTENQKQALAILGKYESAGAGGYNAVNQIGTHGGRGVLGYAGDFTKMDQHGGRALTDMTLGEILALQSDDGKMSNAQWIDAGKLHAVGRYQFVGNTLPGLVEKAGIPKDAKFTSEIQDLLALQLMKERGIQPWVGPSDKATAAERAIIEKARGEEIAANVSVPEVEPKEPLVKGQPPKPGQPGDPGEVEADQQIAGDTEGRYGRIGIPNTDGQDTGADIELFGQRGEIGKSFGDNSKQGPYGNRGVEISFPYDLIYLEKVPGGRNAGHKSIDVQGSTSRDYKAVTGATGFGHIGSYYYKDPETGKMFEVMMGHGNKPFKKFKEGETIKAGTVVGWQGASGSSDSMQGGVYDHVTFHVNAVDGGDPGPVFNMFVDSLVTGAGAQLTAKQREAKKQEELIAKNRPKGSESVLAGKPVVWDGDKWIPKKEGEGGFLAGITDTLGNLFGGGDKVAKAQGGGQIGKPNVKTSAINNVSQFSSYEEPGGGNTVMIQEIEVIKYVTKNKPSSPSVNGGREKKTSDKSYMLRRQ